ncbi:hypothetical protein PNIG_a0479 [Pseudoalteromonas nigrifaciens]|uniref:Uncharacterized protein n=1 Tax=Pseudoalteromonas nigrifaciens TaxID=28109 RepID=A0AAC9UH07_9GAMM|nr:hypothetical protein PNIG_a0479 [Pseudoalteromonas nigrifaciens]
MSSLCEKGWFWLEPSSMFKLPVGEGVATAPHVVRKTYSQIG